jgi:hypothetical protein
VRQGDVFSNCQVPKQPELLGWTADLGDPWRVRPAATAAQTEEAGNSQSRDLASLRRDGDGTPCR